MKNFSIDAYGRVIITDEQLLADISGADSYINQHPTLMKLDGGCENVGCGSNAACSNVACGG